jgi:hypothetical protein
MPHYAAIAQTHSQTLAFDMREAKLAKVPHLLARMSLLTRLSHFFGF